MKYKLTQDIGLNKAGDTLRTLPEPDEGVQLEDDYWISPFDIALALKTGLLEEVGYEKNWRPEKGGHYWSSENGVVIEFTWEDDIHDNRRFCFGTVFATQVLAEEAREKVKELLSLLRKI